MAGYIFNINETMSLDGVRQTACEQGWFAPIIPFPPKNGTPWGKASLSTFGDLITAKEGDTVFFFSKRLIYGAGKLISIVKSKLPEQNTCVLKNFPHASEPVDYSQASREDFLIQDLNPNFEKKNGSRCMRWFVTFEPSPLWYAHGIDMDELLEYAPNRISMLRAMQNVTFIKVDDDESEAIFECLTLKFNKLKEIRFNEPSYIQYDPCLHENILRKLNSENIDSYVPNTRELVATKIKEGNITEEMAIEISILQQIADHHLDSMIGELGYVSHQVPASPFKPLIYRDRIDIFGYSYITSIDTLSLPQKIKDTSFVIEVKKDIVSDINPINQVMKYVDYLVKQNPDGDYSNIRAFLVARDFTDEIIEQLRFIVPRYFTLYDEQKAYAYVWNNLTLLNYELDDESPYLIRLTINERFKNTHIPLLATSEEWPTSLHQKP